MARRIMTAEVVFLGMSPEAMALHGPSNFTGAAGEGVSCLARLAGVGANGSGPALRQPTLARRPGCADVSRPPGCFSSPPAASPHQA